MKTDVFPEEDSVRVYWSREGEWEPVRVQKRGRQRRFGGTPHGLIGGMMGSCLAWGCNGEPRDDLPFTAYARELYNMCYLAGLRGDKFPYGDEPDDRNGYGHAYLLGQDEAQLIDWQA